MLSSIRSQIIVCVVGLLALAGWGLTNAVQKVRRTAERLQGV